MYLHLLTLKYKCVYTYKEHVLKKSTINMIYIHICIYICLLNKYSKYIYIYTQYIYICVYMYSFQVKYTIEKMFWPVTGHPGLAPDISRQVPDIPGVGHPRCRTSQVPDIPALRRTSQGRCRTSRPCTGHLKAGAGHPRCRTSQVPDIAPDISRQVPDIPALRRTSQGRCRTSQVPDIAGAGHPGLAPDSSRQVLDISRQVQDIPALRRTSQGRCRTSQDRYRTSRPSAGLLDE